MGEPTWQLRWIRRSRVLSQSSSSCFSFLFSCLNVNRNNENGALIILKESQNDVYTTIGKTDTTHIYIYIYTRSIWITNRIFLDYIFEGCNRITKFIKIPGNGNEVTFKYSVYRKSLLQLNIINKASTSSWNWGESIASCTSIILSRRHRQWDRGRTLYLDSWYV